MNTEHPDLTHMFDLTLGYCEKHGHTAFACVKCAAETQTDAPSSDLSTIAELHKLRAENARLTAENADMQHELDARAAILNRAVTAKQHKFPAELGNGWIDSIDRLDQGIVDLRREKSAMRAALRVTIDTIEDHRNKVEMPPVLYNALTHVVLVVNQVLDEV